MGTNNKYDWLKNAYYNKGLHSMEDKKRTDLQIQKHIKSIQSLHPSLLSENSAHMTRYYHLSHSAGLLNLLVTLTFHNNTLQWIY